MKDLTFTVVNKSTNSDVYSIEYDNNWDMYFVKDLNTQEFLKTTDNIDEAFEFLYGKLSKESSNEG